MMRFHTAVLAAFAATGLCLASACGGSSGSSEGTVSTVHGTAATGAPLRGAAVTLRDGAGGLVSTTTLDDGTFRLPVGGLQAPFLLKVDDGRGTVLFSVGAQAGVVNVTPYTNLVVSTYYQAQGITLNAAFFDASLGSAPVPTPVEIQTIQSVVQSMIALWLRTHGIDPASFDVLTTPFTADGQGFDAVLEHSTVLGGTIGIGDGTTTQSSTLTVDPSGLVQVITTTTAGGATTTSTDTTLLPTSPQQSTDLGAAAAAARGFFDLVNGKGASLTDADLLPSFDAGFLDGGMDRSVFAASMATWFRGRTPVQARLVRVLALDPVNHVVTVCFEIVATAGGQTLSERLPMAFRLGADGQYLFFGNQQHVDIWFRTEANTYLHAGSPIAYVGTVVDVAAPTGTVNDSVRIDGGPYASTPLPKAPGTRTTRYAPTPTTTLDYVEDFFPGNTTPPALVPVPGTVLHVTCTPVSSGPEVYEVQSNAITTDFITISAPTGHLLADATLGAPLPVTWTLPQTYAVSYVDFHGWVQDAAGNELRVEALEPLLGPTATSGTILLPASWDDGGGHHVTTKGFVTVMTGGTNGEFSHVGYEFKD